MKKEQKLQATTDPQMDYDTLFVVCPDCGGDGKETCHNPDHGFLSGVMSVMGANESECPCCGHDESHKIYIDGKYNKCETCNGVGRITRLDYETYLYEYVPEEYIETVNEHCLNDTIPE
jgi:hypothetical protein